MSLRRGMGVGSEGIVLQLWGGWGKGLYTHYLRRHRTPYFNQPLRIKVAVFTPQY